MFNIGFNQNLIDNYYVNYPNYQKKMMFQYLIEKSVLRND